MNSNVKRCVVSVVLSLMSGLIGFHQLQISPKGLELLANAEGCRLKPYQCTAGTWTNGIGNTAGVVPRHIINERQAAADLISNILIVQQRLATCLKVKPPQSVMDMLISLGFNVGAGQVCHSRMLILTNQGQWRQACRQLPRWIYIKGVKSQALLARRGRELQWCMQDLPS